MSAKPLFDQEALLAILPHRAPFLFVDRVTRLVPHRTIVAERVLRPDEPFFSGHFPGRPIMPGVLVTEALAQASGLLLGLSERQTARPPPKPRMYFLAASTMKFTRPAGPGDVLVLQAEAEKNLGGLFRFSVTASVAGQCIASGAITLAFIDDTSRGGEAT